MENFPSHNEGDISTRCLPLSVDFFLYINMGMCFCLLYLIKIFKMAAELYKGVLLSPYLDPDPNNLRGGLRHGQT